MNNQLRLDRRYKFSYEDKQGNELYCSYHLFPNLKYAKQIAKGLETYSRVQGLHKIKVTTAFI